MTSSTKKAMADAMKKLMKVKSVDRITVNELVEACGLSRQTFYYHFSDVYELLEWAFEEDAGECLPKKVVYDNWKRDVTVWFRYLKENSAFTMNIYNSRSRQYMLQYIQSRLEECVRSFCEIVAASRSLKEETFEFIVSLYTEIFMGILIRWLDSGMQKTCVLNEDRILQALDGSIESLMDRFGEN